MFSLISETVDPQQDLGLYRRVDRLEAYLP